MLFSGYRGVELEFEYHGEVIHEHHVIQDFIEFCMDRLSLFTYRKLRFIFVNNESSKGSFTYSDKEGTILVHDLNSDLHDLFRIISHELIHAQQWITGMLSFFLHRCCTSNRTFLFHRWNEHVIDGEKMEYEELPWEKDAHHRQNIITMEYMLTK